MKLQWLHTAICVATTVCSTSCHKSEESADLVFINGSEPQTLDPAQISGQNEMRIAGALFEGLMRFNENGRAELGQAEKVTISDDGLTYTFTIRPNLTWSNGKSVTAQDFLYSWQRVLEPITASDYAAILYFIKNAEAFHTGKITDFSQVGLTSPNPHTLVVQLHHRTPFFLELCAFLTYAVVPKSPIDNAGKLWTRPENIASNGPYIMETWTIDDRIRLKKNPKYWDAKHVSMEVIDILAIKDPNTAMNYFLTGEADLMMDKSQLPVSLIDELKNLESFHRSSILGTYFVRFNAQRPPFDNPKVRQAITLATDKTYITETITRLGETVAYSFTPPGVAGGYQPPTNRLNFNPEKARALLAEAGYPDGKGFPTVEYLYNEKDIDRNIAVQLQDMWKRNLGINVQLRKEEWRSYLDSLSRLDYDFCRSSWVGDYDDANTFLEIFTSENGNNRTGWRNTAYDEMIAAAARVDDVKQRAEIFRSAEELLISKDIVILPLYHYIGLQFYNDSKLGGINGNLLDVHPFHTMFWKPGA